MEIHMKFKKIKKYKKNYLNSYVYYPYYHKKIDNNLIFIDSMNGEYISSNIFGIMEELSKDQYKNFKIYVYVKKGNIDYLEKLQENYNLKIDKIITNDIKATYVCEYAKYIITDRNIRFRYAKRDGQVIINVYHENPLIKWGIDDIKKASKIGSLQRLFLLSDYILFSNNHSYDKIMKSLLIEDIYDGKIIKEGSPRNISFFKDNSNLKSKLNIEDNQIFVYMPHYLNSSVHKKFVKNVKRNLEEIDKKLNDNQVLFFKVDGYNKKVIDFSKLKHIKPFPLGYTDYDIISLAEAFITDFSSVLLDFINSKRKIILFNSFDNNYSTYLEDLDLPFVNVDNTDELISELNSDFEDYSELLNDYVPYDSADSAKNICQHIFLDKNCCHEEIKKNNKPNVLIFIGNLSDNEITLSLRQLLSQVDVSRYNFILTFHQWSKKFKKDPESILNSLPEGIQIMPMVNKNEPTYIEKIKYHKFLNSDGECNNSIREFFKREFKRQFYNLSFDYVLNYDGYFKNEILMLCNNDAKSSLWVHNDPIKEIENNKFNNNILKEAYGNYDNVVAISSELIKPIKELNDLDNIKIAHNLINFDNIEYESGKMLKLDKDSRVYTHDSSYIRGVLNRPGKKIISINKSIYNKEWSENLLNAFDKLCDDYDDVQLIIVGDFGWFNKIQNLTSKLKNWENVTLIKQLSNPLPILKCCDLFVLPPDYRFYRKYIYESEMLGIPIMSIAEGDMDIIDRFNGYKIENSYENILEGLQDFMNDGVNTLDIDYKQFNNDCLNEFYEIIK